MKISAQSLVSEVMIDNSALYALGEKQLLEAIKGWEVPHELPQRRRLRTDKRIRARSVNELTLQELDSVQQTLSGFAYFEKVLAVMLNIDEQEVRNLRFLCAYRYFLNVLQELKEVGRRWNSLKMPLTAEERRAKVKRPNVGLSSLCQSYNEAMGGGPNGVEDAWRRPWLEVFNYMQQKYYDALEQRRRMDAIRKKTK